MLIPDDDEGTDKQEPPEERPMTAAVAILWSVLATSLLIVLLWATHAARPSAATDLVNGLACTAAAYLLCIYLMARTHAGRHALSDFLAIRHTHPALYPLAAGIGICLQVPAEMVQRVLEHRWPSSPEAIAEQLATFQADTLTRRLMLAAVVACLGPLVEELLYRGALHRGLRRQYSNLAVVPLGAALFAAGHVDPRLMVPVLIVGLFLGLIRAASGSLVPSLVAHMCFNAVVVFGILSGTADVGPDTMPIPVSFKVGGIAGTAVLTLVFLLVARRSTRAEAARQEDLA